MTQWVDIKLLYGTNMVRCLFFIIVFFSTQIDANEICDTESGKCEKVGTGGAWMLSIIETSVIPCGNPTEITNWLAEHDWLLDRVKAKSTEYDHLFKMQKRLFWNAENKDKTQHCSKLITLIKNGNPLNSNLR
ncbi:hypothetical protein [Pseudoalteromonas spongiae]|uniref:hypothetical protein n=1 Tax=Pseudoalteromonas spongiae TaxID=298657 RepID=UPI00110A235E|nr:hypothetical protein [Pseudoalteromonas spongiae]TMO83582.1 hypothetical protein CWC15_14945 [Pseudoalteromonas spongiae]